MSATVESNMLSASRLHTKCFQYACETGETKDTPKGKTGMTKA